MKFKENAQITTSEFWYDLFDGGYIKPEDLLVDESDAKAVRDAMDVLERFQQEAENQGVIEEM